MNPDYRCFVFRAANWSVYPGRNVIRALVNNGIKADTSIFKYGRRKGIVSFDYSAAESELVPWRVGEADLSRVMTVAGCGNSPSTARVAGSGLF